MSSALVPEFAVSDWLSPPLLPIAGVTTNLTQHKNIFPTGSRIIAPLVREDDSGVWHTLSAPNTVFPHLMRDPAGPHN